MNSENNQKIDELTQTLLKKCEVSNLNQFYHKWVKENNHIGLVKKICAIHKNFNETKVLQDVAEIPDLVIINILDFTRKNALQKNLPKEKYLINHVGLGKTLNSLKRRKIIHKSSNLNQLFKKLGISEEDNHKVLKLLQNAIEDTIIYAHLNEKMDVISFYNKIKHPNNKKELMKLIITLIIGIVAISILLPILYIINTS